MKHIFIVETSDDELINPSTIDDLTTKIEGLVEVEVGALAVARSICNIKSAIRGVYRLYHADETKSPDDLGSTI